MFILCVYACVYCVIPSVLLSLTNVLFVEPFYIRLIFVLLYLLRV